ncbi:hypothetical protein PJI17_32485, partial [Mycobacterium kansasii]
GNQIILVLAEPEIILPVTVNFPETDIPVIDVQHTEDDISYHSFKFEIVNSIANQYPLAAEYVIPLLSD